MRGENFSLRKIILLGIIFFLPFFLFGKSRVSGELDKIKAEIEREKSRLEAKSKKERKILAELEAMEKKIRLYDRKIEQLRKIQKGLNQELKKLEKEEEELEEKIQAQKELLAQRLRARYKLGEVGVIQVLFASEGISDLVLRDEYFGRILEQDEELLEQFEANKKELEKKKEQIKEKQAQLQKAIETQNWAKAELEKEKKEKTQLLSKIQKEKEIHLKVIAELDASRRELEKKLNWLSRKRKGESEFGYFRGKLCLPVKGTIEEGFGEKIDPEFKTKTFHKGIDIRAKKGEPVRAIYAGEVVYADWFRGYGYLVIIDHGSSYYSLYAHLDQMTKKAGEVVNKGEVIGWVGDTGSLKGAYLYFELRHHSRAINPEKWLNVNCVEQGKE